MSFFDISEADLDAATPIIFNAGEVIEFLCLDFNETKNGAAILNCKVLSGENAGKTHTIFLNNHETPTAKKNRVQFLLAFWSKEELIAGENKRSKLINRKFTVVASAPRDYEGKTYQDLRQFVDLGESLDTNGVDASSLGSTADHADSPRF